jgi:hypothetical protein
MGDNNTGGGGSVRWSINANSVEAADVTGDGPHYLEGHDKDGDVGDFFTVSIRAPKKYKSAQDYLDDLKLAVDQDPGDGKRIYFNLPIEEHFDQVRVSWGGSPYHRGKGGKKRARTLKKRTGTSKKRAAR